MEQPGPGSFCLGHVHLKVRDVARSVAFYRRTLDLEVTERDGPIAFLSWDERHHDVALQEVESGAAGSGSPDGADDGAGRPPSVGLNHVAFEVPDESTLGAVYGRLSADGVPVSAVDHGISEALYFDDPDGNGLEVYVDTRSTGAERWEGQSRSFDPERLTDD